MMPDREVAQDETRADPEHRRAEEGDPQADSVVATGGTIGEIATRLLTLAQDPGFSGLVFVAASERRATQAASALESLFPGGPITFVPAWDCLPYDRAAPSRLVMGQRIAALVGLAGCASGPRIVVTTVPAMLQRIPPRDVWSQVQRKLRVGEALSLDRFRTELTRFGYVLDERIDEPGEAAIRGQVIDLFLAGSADPVRIDHAEDRITAIRCFDPATQLTNDERQDVLVLPTSEWIPPEDAEPMPERHSGVEHWLPEIYPKLETLFDYLPGACIALDVGADERVQAGFAQIQDAYESRRTLRPERALGRSPLPPNRLYLTAEDFALRIGGRALLRFAAAGDPTRATPRFAEDPAPFRALADFLRDEEEAGHRVVVTAAADEEIGRLGRQVARHLGATPGRVASWAEARESEPGSILLLRADLDAGFRDTEAEITLIAAPDILGSRAVSGPLHRSHAPEIAGTEIEFRLGDAVIHTDHGLGLLAGIETVETDGAAKDLIRLTYGDDDTLMVPVEEMDRIWRYGAASESLSLDRLDGESWERRKEKVEAEIGETARRLVAAMQERQAASAERLIPPRRAYERFVAGFPFAETPDQVTAIEDTLRDLASGRPMNRLVCGDVGFGKTEIALRAAAAAALSGKQVAVVAPTTVLVRQHVETFRKRFAGLGIEVAHLSRLVKTTEARNVKQGLASGEIRVVIGTHAVAGKGVRFADLGLVVIDEEQRFGAAHKEKIRALGRDAHVLTLTATPIPRTLQAALVGLQDTSVIASPPARRQPIRTFMLPFDEASVREALMREHRRGGQSFIVCPRIEDIEPMAARIAQLVPELETLLAHGKMPPETIDDVMVRFSVGEGDVLLATNIIESGLDVSRANTMLIWRADRFGLAQLHQLRGRVGRGPVRGVAYLITDPHQKLARSTRKRLETLESLDRLGAGFAISARDLDQRGAGDLLGEQQAGHIKLIGVGLYQHLLEQAVAASRGARPGETWTPEVNLGLRGFIPADYVPEPEVRINLYARFAKATSGRDIDSLEDEIENRFGSLPAPVEQLLALARVAHQCRKFHVARVDAGPQALALTFREGADVEALSERALQGSKGALEQRNGRLIWAKTSTGEKERLDHATKLFRFLAQSERSS